MKQKKLFLALALSSMLLTACSGKPGFELVDVSSEDSSTEVEETKQVTEKVEQEFPITTEVDSSLSPGEYKIVQKGERGESNITYEISMREGQEVSRKAMSEEVLKKPVAAIVKIAPTEDFSDVGAREIIAYSEPKSDKYAEPPRINNTRTDHDLVKRILADPAALEKDGDEQEASSDASSQQSSKVKDIRIVPAGPEDKPAQSSQTGKPSKPSKPNSSSHTEQSSKADSQSSAPAHSEASHTEEPAEEPLIIPDTEQPAPPQASNYIPSILD